ncbi:hypothetical protein BDY17DRAFT_319752 [Neohortaea acidophila]|uniref:DUF6594 domain-containing protein n=1 Tax=Neohortaea acidophila TaxID=245834 RepID=A0A6A6Q4H5_9PEZI|nr:uncharacterized protein BDY17DRAFT_319752 [Neohortaea acidophila]KAF2487192.1 hypothetical protein BDY17DRAFT_319752 [Neohortaea acidophila]
MSGNERLDASLELQPSVEDESEDKPDVPPSLPSPLEEQAQHPRPGFQHSSPQHADGVSHDYNFPSSHMPYAQRGYPHYRPTVYDQPRVLPTPWSPPPHSLYFHQTPPQHYPWPSPSGTTVPTHAVNNHTTPPASRSNHATGTGPPDNNTAPSKPDFEPPALYRRFAHLTHRILLSLQDELLDLEAHLQRYDEAIGTLQRATPAQPGSRTAHQPEWQHRQNDRDLLLCRAQLLAQIEAKMERYHRHLSTSASISGHTSPATPEQIDSYKQWIKTHSPSNEERLLSDPTDLIVPCSNTRALLTLVRSNSPITIFALLVLLYTAREKSGGPVLVFAGIVVAWPFMAPFAGPRLRMGLPANDFAFLGAMFAMVAAWLGVV